MSGYDPNAAPDTDPSPDDVFSAMDAAPLVEPSPDDVFAELQRRQASALDTSARVAATKDPAAHANVIRMADRTGLPRDVVERNQAQVKEVAAQKDVDLESLMAHSPILASWVSKIDNMAQARDDLKSLQGLEWWTGRMHPSGETAAFGRPRMVYDEGAWSRAIRVGGAQRERSDLLLRAMLSGADPSENPRIAELESFMSEDYGKESHGTFARMATGTLETLGSLASGVGGGLAMGAEAAALTMAAGPEAAPLVPATASAGFLAGVGYDTWQQESGAAYGDIVEAMKERGGAVNFRTAAAAASVVGAANAVIEVAGSKVAMTLFPFLQPVFGGISKKADFGGLTLRKAMAQAAVKYMATFGAEVGTETGQAGVTALGRETVVGSEGGQTNFAGIIGEMGTEAKEAALSLALLIVPGPAGQFHSDVSSMRQGLAAKARLESLGGIARNVRLAETNPAAMAEFADGAAAANGHPESVLVAADAWTTLFQSKGIDPAAAAEQIGVGQEYANAKETGGFVAIPFGKYVSEIAPTEYHAALVPDAKFYQESMTPKEAQEHQKVLTELPFQMTEADVAARKMSPIYMDRFSKLISIGVPETDADHYAKLHESYFKAQAARTGLTEEDLSTIFPLDIKSDVSLEANGSIKFFTEGGEPSLLNKAGAAIGLTERRGPGFTMTLSTKNADRSTFLHETGHYFLETFADLAYRGESTDQTRADFETLLGYFHVKTREEITPEHHEKFARAFEKYLQEGKAPSLQLVRTFARFSAWLKSIYRKIGGLGVELSDEVRGVMDRMIATDDAIANVENAQAYIPMFKSAAEAGMSEAAFAEYQNKAAQAHDEAARGLGARIAAEKRRETETWWQEERVKVQEQVAAEINSERQVEAFRYFAQGQMPEGADLQVFADEKGQPFKLSSKAIDADYPGISQTARKVLGRSGMTATGGIHPDAVAPLFGYESGDELLLALTTQAHPDARITRQTAAAMIEKHGDILNDGTLPEASQEAARDSKARLSQLLQELDALNRRAGNRRVRLTAADLKAAAFENIRAGKVRDLDPASYQRAERTAATNAIKAAGKGKYDEAVEWQRRRLLNFALAREATEAKREADSAVRFLRNSGGPAARAKLGLAGGTYQEQQDALLGRFDFRNRTLKAIDRTQALGDWITEQEALSFDPVVSQKLRIESFKEHWKNLSVNDLLDLRNAVKSIQYTASIKNKLIVVGKERAAEAVKEEALESIKKNIPDPGRAVIDSTTAGAVERFAQFRNKFDAWAVRLEELALQMDGNDPNGIFSQFLVHAPADAQAAEKTLGMETATKLLRAFEQMPKADMRLLHTGRVYVKSIDQTFTFKGLLGIAANYGNDSNYSKLLGGYQTEQGGLIKWSDATIEEALSHLTEAHWDYVQNFWNILDALWPAAEALEKRRTGLAPPKVERRSFTRQFADGTSKTYEGGYYPVIAHPKFSSLLAEKMTGPDGGPFDAKSYVAAITPHGHLIERTGANFAIDLDINRLPGHVVQVVHDTTHREAIINAWRFITVPEIAAEIKHRLGLPYYQAMLERLRRIAGARGMSSFGGDYMAAAQSAMAAAVMGYKGTVATQNFANLAIAHTVVGELEFGKAAVDLINNHAETMEFIKNSSPEMRYRMTTRDNEVRREFERAVTGDSWVQAVRRSGYTMANMTNALIDYPTWLAKYRMELAAKLTHEQAVRSADSTIRTNFGAGGVKDIAAFQDDQIFRYFSMFSGWFNNAYNQQRRLIRETKGLAAEGRYAKAAKHAIMNEFWRVAVMAVASEILSGRGPKDGEKAWDWALTQIALYHASMIPFVKEMSSALAKKNDPRLFGLESLALSTVRAIESDVKAFKGGNILPAVEDSAALIATLYGLPVSQAQITGGYIRDLATGRERFRKPSDALKFIFRRDKERRR